MTRSLHNAEPLGYIQSEVIAKAEEGYQVTGFDISQRSIEYAQESAARKGQAIEYECADYLSYEFPENAYALAILIYCDFGVLSPEKRKILLEKVYKSLKPGARFVVDVFSAAQYHDFKDSEEIVYESGGFWSNEPHVLIAINKAYPNRHYLERYLVITEKECRTYNIWNHAFGAEELIAELENAGFENVALYSDALGNEFTNVSKTICAVAEKT